MVLTTTSGTAASSSLRPGGFDGDLWGDRRRPLGRQLALRPASTATYGDAAGFNDNLWTARRLRRRLLESGFHGAISENLLRNSIDRAGFDGDFWGSSLRRGGL